MARLLKTKDTPPLKDFWLLHHKYISTSKAITKLKSAENSLKYALQSFLELCEDKDTLAWAYWNANINFVKKAAKMRGVTLQTYKMKYTGLASITCKCGYTFESFTRVAGCPKCKENQEKRHQQIWDDVKAREQDKAHTEKLDQEWLDKLSYQEYLQSPEWQDIRRTHLNYAHYSCQLCNSGGILHVHHRHYNSPRGQEGWRDLIVLCKDCHGKLHDKIPQSEQTARAVG